MSLRITQLPVLFALVVAMGLLTASGLPAQPNPIVLRGAKVPATIRVAASSGVMFIHRPPFVYTRDSVDPEPFIQRATDAGGVVFGGNAETITEHWWTGIGGHLLRPFADNSTSIITTIYAGPVVPDLLGSQVRLALAPAVVYSNRQARDDLAVPCLRGCAPSPNPSSLITAGIGVLVVAEWMLWNRVRIGFDGQLAAGPQRFSVVRLRLSN